jgi:hypothetical protein
LKSVRDRARAKRSVDVVGKPQAVVIEPRDVTSDNPTSRRSAALRRLLPAVSGLIVSLI